MIYYDRIDVTEGIYVNKRSAAKKCIVCHYWYFLDKRFRFQPVNCSGCHGNYHSVNYR